MDEEIYAVSGNCLGMAGLGATPAEAVADLKAIVEGCILSHEASKSLSFPREGDDQVLLLRDRIDDWEGCDVKPLEESSFVVTL